jgi:hypothetical protein
MRRWPAARISASILASRDPCKYSLSNACPRGEQEAASAVLRPDPWCPLRCERRGTRNYTTKDTKDGTKNTKGSGFFETQSLKLLFFFVSLVSLVVKKPSAVDV